MALQSVVGVTRIRTGSTISQQPVPAELMRASGRPLAGGSPPPDIGARQGLQVQQQRQRQVAV